MTSHVDFDVLRLRQPLLRGDRRLHPLRRARHGQAHHAVGRDQRQAAAPGGREGQPLHPEPHVGPDLQAGRARRVLPRPQPQGRGRARAVRRPRPAERAPRVPRPRRPPEAHGRAGHGRRDLPPHARRRHGAGAARRPARAARRVPRLQPLARRGLGLRVPGAHLRRADALVRRPRRGAEDRSQWSLDHDARFFVLVPGPVITASGPVSPADPVFDPVWSLLNESGAVLTAHGGNAYYTRYLADWGEGTEMEAFRQNPFRSIVSWSAVQDWFANLLAHGLFARFPNLRMASIETGSDWVFHLFDKLEEVVLADAVRLPGRPARDVPTPRVGVAVLRGRPRRPARPHRRRPHADGIRLPARRRSRRARARTSRTSRTSASAPRTRSW